MTDTYWNGEPTEATRGTAIVAAAPEFPNYWANDLIGQRIDVVRVVMDTGVTGGVQYLDDRNGDGWVKVTVGHGSPNYAHANVQIEEDSYLPYEEDEAEEGG